MAGRWRLHRVQEVTQPQPGQPIQIFTHVPSPAEQEERRALIAELADARERLAALEARMETLPTGWVGGMIEEHVRENSRKLGELTRRVNLMSRYRRVDDSA